MYCRTHKSVVTLKKPQRHHQKRTEMSRDCKSNRWGAGLETKVVSQSPSALSQFQAMCVAKVSVLQNECAAHSFEAHKRQIPSKAALIHLFFFFFCQMTKHVRNCD